MFDIINNAWSYRYFILNSIRNDLIAKFARSKLGALWMLINPLIQVLTYTLILSNVFSARLTGIDNKYGYAIHLMAGMLAWSIFSEIITCSTRLFLEKANLIKKIKFPLVTLPSVVIGTSLLNNILLFISMLVIFALFGHMPTIHLIWLIPLTLLVIALATGMGLICGILNVFIRDIGQAVPILLQLGFWFTPILYPVTIIPERFRYLLDFNPMSAIVLAYQDILVYGVKPHLSQLFNVTVFSVLLIVLSLFLFRRAGPEMVDVL